MYDWYDNCPVYYGYDMWKEVKEGTKGLWTLNFDEFLHILRLMNERQTPEYYHHLLAFPTMLDKITYETVPIYGPVGGENPDSKAAIDWK